MDAGQSEGRIITSPELVTGYSTMLSAIQAASSNAITISSNPPRDQNNPTFFLLQRMLRHASTDYSSMAQRHPITSINPDHGAGFSDINSISLFGGSGGAHIGYALISVSPATDTNDPYYGHTIVFFSYKQTNKFGPLPT